MSQPSGVINDGTKVLLGRGAVYVDRWTSALVPQGEKLLGTCDAFALTPSEDTIEKIGMVDATNPIIARAITQRKLELSITMNEVDKGNLALAFLGTENNYTQGNTARVDVACHPAGGVLLDRWYKNGSNDRKISSTPTVKTGTIGGGAAGATTKTLGTDYYVDAENGRIYVIPTGTIVSGHGMWLSYTPTTITTLDEIDLLNASGVLTGFVRFEGDPVTGPILDVELWKVALTAGGGDIALIGTDWAGFQLKGLVLSDAVNHPTTPFGRILRR